MTTPIGTTAARAAYTPLRFGGRQWFGPASTSLPADPHTITGRRPDF